MIDGVLLDVDGVLTVSWQPLPGAVETVEWLRSHDMAFRLVTNTSSKSRRQLVELLTQAGIPVAVEQIITAVTSAARLLNQQYAGHECLIINEGDLGEDLPGVVPVPYGGADRAGVVLLGGAGPSIGYGQLNLVFRLAEAGVPVVALHRNTRYQTADGPALDMGAFIAALQVATNVDITIVGKPAPDFFAAALADLGVEASNALMVGDDIGSDVVGAQQAGCIGVLVKTGKFRDSDLDGTAGRPDHVIDGIGELPGLLERLCADGSRAV